MHAIRTLLIKIAEDAPIAIRDAVHSDLETSRRIYGRIDAPVQRLGADPADQIPFEKYAEAAESLVKPSSAARAVANGAPIIERVDMLMQFIGQSLDMRDPAIDRPSTRSIARWYTTSAGNPSGVATSWTGTGLSCLLVRSIQEIPVASQENGCISWI